MTQHVFNRRISLAFVLLAGLFYPFSSYASEDVESFFISNIFLKNGYDRGSVWDGKFVAPNGNAFDTSDFYEAKRETLTGNLNLNWMPNDHLLITVPTNFDTGYESALFKTEAIIGIGFGISYRTSNRLIQVGGLNLIQIGGDTSERPCVDSFSRQYHCGTGLPWSESSSIFLKHDYSKEFYLRYAYRF